MFILSTCPEICTCIEVNCALNAEKQQNINPTQICINRMESKVQSCSCLPLSSALVSLSQVKVVPVSSLKDARIISDGNENLPVSQLISDSLIHWQALFQFLNILNTCHSQFGIYTFQEIVCRIWGFAQDSQTQLFQSGIKEPC